MGLKEFVLPLSDKDLLGRDSKHSNQYIVTEITPTSEIAQKIKSVSSRVVDECSHLKLRDLMTASVGPFVFATNFDLFYSFLRDIEKVNVSTRGIAWDCCVQTLSKCVNIISKQQNQGNAQQWDDDNRMALRQVLKMSCFILERLLEFYEDKVKSAAAVSLALSAPSKKRKKAAVARSDDTDVDKEDWAVERDRALQLLADMINCDNLASLWSSNSSPSSNATVEDSLINLLIKAVCLCLSNPDLSAAGSSKSAPDTNSCKSIMRLCAKVINISPNQLPVLASKMIYLLRNNEKSLTSIIELSIGLAETYQHNKFIFEILREIGSCDPAEFCQDSESTKTLTSYLVQLSARLPHLFFKWFFFLLPHFQEESYSFRMALCSISGEVLQYAFQAANSKSRNNIQTSDPDHTKKALPTKEECQKDDVEFTEQQKKSRDELFEELQLHVHDVHANVRARAMATLSHLLETGLIPLDNAVELLQFVAPSVDDVASSVRKTCIQLLAHFIAVYPFAFRYQKPVFEALLKDEKLALQEIMKASNKQAQQVNLMTREEAEKKWEDSLSEQLVKHLVKESATSSSSKRRLARKKHEDSEDDESEKENGNETKEEEKGNNSDEEEEPMETNEDKLAKLLAEVRVGLESGNFKEAIGSIEKALQDHPSCPLFVAAANNPTLREEDDEEEERVQKTPDSIVGKKRVVMLHDLMKAVYIAPFAKLSVNSNEAADKMLSARNLRRRSQITAADQASTINSSSSNIKSGGKDLAELLEKLPAMSAEQMEELICTQRNKILLIQRCVKIQRVFCKQVLPACWNLLGSPTPSDVTTAIEFLVICVQFGLDIGSGIGRLNSLLACPDAAIRAAVVSAFQRIYFEQNARTQRVAQNLISLAKEDCCGETHSDWLSLQFLVCEFVKLGQMNEKVVNYLWEVVTLKHNDIHTEQDRLLSVALLGMAAKEKPAMVKSNLNVLIKFTLTLNNTNDVTQCHNFNFFLANEALKALLMTCQSEQYERLDDSLRILENHELVNCLSTLLVTGLRYTGSTGWMEFVGSAVKTIFTLVRDPLSVMNNILKECHPQNIIQVCTKEGQEEAGNKSDVNEELLRRFLSLLGHVAQNTAAFLEMNVMNEVEFHKKKREAEKELKRASKRADRGTNVSAGALDKSSLSRTRRGAAADVSRQSMTHSVASTTMSNTMGGETSGLTNNAMNECADMIKAICDDAIVTGPGMLAKFVPFIKACLLPVGAAAAQTQKKASVGSSPLQGHPSAALRASATVTLAKFMLTSENMCRENLQLLFTIMEKDPDAVIRSNVISLTADLLIRFPNAVAPWTPNIYGRLHDKCDDVRLNCVITVAQLVLKEQIKVKGQISEMAKCILDPNPKIAAHAKRLFEELAKKNNTLYNVLADIISRLSGHSVDCHDDAEKQVIDDVMEDDITDGNDLDEGEGNDCDDESDEDNSDQECEAKDGGKKSSKGSQFNQIIGFIIKLLPREKLSELLVDKMCQRFKIVSSSARQCRNLGFVLSLLHYNEKAFTKLQDHLPTYAPVLRNNKPLLRYFHIVIENCKKNCKPEMKQTIMELESSMEAAFHGEDKDQLEGDEKENEENIAESPRPSSSSQRRTKQTSSTVSSEGGPRASRYNTSRAASSVMETPRPRRGANTTALSDTGKSVNKKSGLSSKEQSKSKAAKPRRRAAMLDSSASSLDDDEKGIGAEDTEESSQSEDEPEDKKIDSKKPPVVARKTARNARNVNDSTVSSSSLDSSVRRSLRNVTLSPLEESNRQPQGKRTRRK